MSDGQISVDLRLALKKLRDDIRDANKMIKEGLSKSLNLGGGGGSAAKETKDSGAAMDQLAIKTKRVTSALAEQLNAWKKLQNFRKPKIIDNSGNNPAGNRTYGPGAFVGSTMGGGLATGSPYMGAIPPIIPKAGPPASIPPSVMQTLLSRASGALNAAGSGKMNVNPLRVIGSFVTSLGKVLAVSYLLERAFSKLNYSVQTAQALYAKSLQSGLGLKYTAQRSLMAEALGVNENEIYRFGDALKFLQPKLEWSSKTLSATAPGLTEFGLRMEVLKDNLKAATSVVVTDFLPALTSMIEKLSKSAKSLGQDWADASKKWEAAGAFVKKFGGTGLSVSRVWLPGQSPLEQPKGYKFEQDGKEITGGLAEKLKAQFEKFLSGYVSPGGALKNPQAFMKQMPVSSYERMGLVAGIASSPMVDYSRRTAVATETIAKHVANMGNHGGVPRAFNMDPEVATP